MKNVKMVYINEVGELNFCGEGRQATLVDLEDDLCLGGEPLEEVIEVADGSKVVWQDFTFIDPEDFMGYVKIA